jgi:hypothetical protein
MSNVKESKLLSLEGAWQGSFLGAHPKEPEPLWNLWLLQNGSGSSAFRWKTAPRTTFGSASLEKLEPELDMHGGTELSQLPSEEHHSNVSMEHSHPGRQGRSLVLRQLCGILVCSWQLTRFCLVRDQNVLCHKLVMPQFFLAAIWFVATTMACHTFLVPCRTSHRPIFLSNFATSVALILFAELSLAATVCQRLDMASFDHQPNRPSSIFDVTTW